MKAGVGPISPTLHQSSGYLARDVSPLSLLCRFLLLSVTLTPQVVSETTHGAPLMLQKDGLLVRERLLIHCDSRLFLSRSLALAQRQMRLRALPTGRMQERLSRHLCICGPRPPPLQPGSRETKCLMEYGPREVLYIRCMLGDRLYKFAAAPLSGCHMSRGATANVGSDAGGFITDNDVRPFE